MSMARLSHDDPERLPFGRIRPAGSQSRLEGSANENRSHSHASRCTSALAQKPARHEFAIEDLGQAGCLKPHRYRYFCIRCRRMSLMENRRGDATVDESGRHSPEKSTSAATFGPYPAAPPEKVVVCEKRGFTADLLTRQRSISRKARNRVQSCFERLQSDSGPLSKRL
jgi:hypothetical protein